MKFSNKGKDSIDVFRAQNVFRPIRISERAPKPEELAPDKAAPWPANVGGWCWVWNERDASSWDVAWPNGRDGDLDNWLDFDPRYVTHFLPWNALPVPSNENN